MIKKIFLGILTVFTTLGAVICLGFTIFYQTKTVPIHDISASRTSSLEERVTIHIDELEVLSRYAFKTIQSSYNTFGQPEDTTYYVYEASKPMDDNDLWAEYYVVKFTDQEKEYITSLTISAEKALGVALENTPVSITACVNAFPVSTGSDDNQLGQLRAAALDDWTQRTGIAKANVTFGYQAQSAEQLRAALKKDTTELRLTMGITGLILSAFSVWFIIDWVKKAKAQ